MKVLIVIVCYKAVDLTIDCLRSLEPEIATVPGTKVAVCENGTGPDAVAQIEKAIETNGWSDWIELTAIHPNRGFTGGNNAILDPAVASDDPPEYFLLLNADTIVRPGALKQLVDAADADPAVGIIGPRLEAEDGSPQVSCFRFHNPLSELIQSACTGPVTRLLEQRDVVLGIPDSPVDVQWLSFACALVRREVLQQIGTFDEGYFLYFDDPDLCRRAHRAGWRMRYWPYARVMHLCGQSNPLVDLEKLKKRRPSYYYVSRTRYFAKYYGRTGLLAANALWNIGRLVSLTRETLGRKRPHLCKQEWRDIWTNFWSPLRMPDAQQKAQWR
ncbi:MAG: glycosyltransferase family 2 protein [Phycisphaeraceae bacterium]